MNTLGTQTNTQVARSFRQIVTAGWANLSDGNVESPQGHFAVVHIEPAEMSELVDATEINPDVTIYPGSYLVMEDSDGNTTVTEYLTLDRCMQAYNQLAKEFAIWDAECPECHISGPYQNVGTDTNLLKCDNGHFWNPTEGME